MAAIERKTRHRAMLRSMSIVLELMCIPRGLLLSAVSAPQNLRRSWFERPIHPRLEHGLHPSEGRHCRCFLHCSVAAVLLGITALASAGEAREAGVAAPEESSQ